MADTLRISFEPTAHEFAVHHTNSLRFELSALGIVGSSTNCNFGSCAVKSTTIILVRRARGGTYLLAVFRDTCAMHKWTQRAIAIRVQGTNSEFALNSLSLKRFDVSFTL